jgi:prepilin-type N-terminal cleavage/methylation domain-containing protein
MNMASAASSNSNRRGFTLIEVMVTVVIIALMAAMIVPRFAGNDVRSFKLAVEQVSDLLMMYAQHESLGQKIVGLHQNAGDNSLELLLLDSQDLTGRTGDWTTDPFVKPVKLPTFMLETDVEIYADNERVDLTEAPLSNELGKDRPTIMIVLRGANENAAITLYPYAVSPEVVSSYSNTSTGRMPIDLDTTGHGREDW